MLCYGKMFMIILKVVEEKLEKLLLKTGSHLLVDYY